MPGDPKECRLHALRCVELAKTAQTEHLRVSLLQLWINWVRIADSLELVRALLDEEGVEIRKPA